MLDAVALFRLQQMWLALLLQAHMYPHLPEVCVFMTNRNVPLPEVLPSVRCLSHTDS